MSNKFTLPPKGFVFWPVGTGDSSSVVVKEKGVILQIDLHHMQKSDNEDEPAWPIIDELVRLLPKKNDRPYLTAFVLTHPDEDHILGFKELLTKVHIGEIWHTPRIFTEYKKDLCEDAKGFKKEVERRRDVTIKKKGDVKSGDRVRVIGHHDIFLEDDYKDFPQQWRTSPGTSVTQLDGVDHAETFEAFIHAPFKDENGGDRNETSLALQVTLGAGEKSGKGLFFGDRDYPSVKRIFDKTKEKKRPEYLEWNVLLSPHHCSKSVMYWQEEGEKEETFRKDIMGDLEAVRCEGGFVLASSHADFSDEEGKNPPHLKARKRYEEIVDSGHFICTHEHPSKKAPQPVVFVVDDEGFRYEKPTGKADAATSVASAVAAARGGTTPPKEQVGFGSFP